MVQLSAASQRALNSHSSICFVCEGAESGPKYLEKCKIRIVPARFPGVTGSGDE